jgi:hypothetical protein
MQKIYRQGQMYNVNMQFVYQQPSLINPPFFYFSRDRAKLLLAKHKVEERATILLMLDFYIYKKSQEKCVQSWQPLFLLKIIIA